MKIIKSEFHKNINLQAVISLFVILFSLFLVSCEKYEIKIPEVQKIPLALSASDTNLVLNQKFAKNAAVALNWTTGTNYGTGASISYILQIDKKGNKFAQALTVNMGKVAYTKSYTVADLNNLLLTKWALTPNAVAQLDARVIANIASETVKPDTSKVITIYVKPYKPVTTELYMVGDAAPSGWDIGNATKMTADANEPTKFWFQGIMKVGNFKLPVNRNTNWAQDMYMANSPTTMYLHLGGAADDKQWYIDKAGLYKIEVNLLDLTISITAQNGPAYDKIYIFGSATPNGWDINNPTLMTQSLANPFLFTYDGILKAGEFKFPTKSGTWSQDMFMRTDDTHAYLHIDGTAGDDKWTVVKEGLYHVKLNLLDNTVSVLPFELFMVGSAAPCGWNIGSATQMTVDATYGYIFTYTGAMVAGEFKFPVNRNSDWGQDMYMRDAANASKIYLHVGGAADDNKWNITEAGNYTITVNIKDLTISIVKL